MSGPEPRWPPRARPSSWTGRSGCRSDRAAAGAGRRPGWASGRSCTRTRPGGRRRGARLAARFADGAALPGGPWLHGGGVVCWDDLGGYLALAEHVPPELIPGIPDVRALDRLAAGRGGNLIVATLHAVCTTDSIRHAGNAMHLHHSSVAARLTRAEDELGFSVRRRPGAAGLHSRSPCATCATTRAERGPASAAVDGRVAVVGVLPPSAHHDCGSPSRRLVEATAADLITSAPVPVAERPRRRRAPAAGIGRNPARRPDGDP